MNNDLETGPDCEEDYFPFECEICGLDEFSCMCEFDDAEFDDTARRDWEREIYKRCDEENRQEFDGKEGER